MEERFNLMLQGDPATGAPARTDPRLLDNIHELIKHWRTEIRPILERVASKATREEVGADLDRLNGLVDEQIERTNRGIKLAHQVQAEHFDQFRFALLILGALLLLVIGVMLVIVRGLIRHVRSLARTADRIAVGELTVRTNVGGSDEMSMLSAAFDSMTEKLCGTLEAEQASRGRIEMLLTTEQKSRARVENLLGNIREAVSWLTASSAEILASTSQQTAGAQERAAAISETVVTVDQVAQTASQSAQRAKEVGDTVQKTLEIGQAGRKAAEDSIAATGTVKERIESTAQDILELAE
jgi:methyl-accepting chemotaxis protein